MIGEASSFIRRFDGDLGKDVCCQPYFKLVPVSNGCPYYCTYCYLAYVYRDHLPFIKVNVNHDTMFREIHRAIASADGDATFNMGEMLDSLALDHVTHLTTALVPFFSSLSHAYLMLLTKSSNIDSLLAMPPNDRVVVSWSLNSEEMIKAYEPGTATLTERLTAARRCQEHGYRIRRRIDPGILHPGWQTGYRELVQRALDSTEPENITLGTLRLLPGHLALAAQAYGRRGRSLRHMLIRRASDGKLRYQPEQRVRFYRLLIDAVRSHNRNVSIGLCRESSEVWNALRRTCNPCKCNCLVW